MADVKNNVHIGVCVCVTRQCSALWSVPFGVHLTLSWIFRLTSFHTTWRYQLAAVFFAYSGAQMDFRRGDGSDKSGQLENICESWKCVGRKPLSRDSGSWEKPEPIESIQWHFAVKRNINLQRDLQIYKHTHKDLAIEMWAENKKLDM